MSILTLLGLAVVFAIGYFTGGVAWYAWIIGALGPPIALIALAFLTASTEASRNRTIDSNDDADAT